MRPEQPKLALGLIMRALVRWRRRQHRWGRAVRSDLMSHGNSMPRDVKGPAFAVLACGTRGDAQPLLALSIALNDSLPSCGVTLITHSAHQASLRSHPVEQQTLPVLRRRRRKRAALHLPEAHVRPSYWCRHGWRSRPVLRGCSCTSCPPCRRGAGTAPRQRAARRKCAAARRAVSLEQRPRLQNQAPCRGAPSFTLR